MFRKIFPDFFLGVVFFSFISLRYECSNLTDNKGGPNHSPWAVCLSYSEGQIHQWNIPLGSIKDKGTSSYCITVLYSWYRYLDCGSYLLSRLHLILQLVLVLGQTLHPAENLG